MKTFLCSLFDLFNNIFETFLNSVLLHLPVYSTVKRCLSQNTPQNCKINKPVSALFGKVRNSCAITYILGEVINPYATANVLSIAQNSQTSECNVEQYSTFMQKWIVSYKMKCLYVQRLSSTGYPIFSCSWAGSVL